MDWFEMPGASLIKIKSGQICLSCGCECYSREMIYVHDGQPYLHVWGYPVVSDVRGIYRLHNDTWVRIVGGRPRPRLVFAPDGSNISYYDLNDENPGLRLTPLL